MFLLKKRIATLFDAEGCNFTFETSLINAEQIEILKDMLHKKGIEFEVSERRGFISITPTSEGVQMGETPYYFFGYIISPAKVFNAEEEMLTF